MTEIWKTIENYETYSVSTFGRVRNDTTGKFLKGGKGSNRYTNVNLCKKGERKMHYVHRLVAIAFIPNPENKDCVDHRDGNPTNNTLVNLRWASRSENIRNSQLSAGNTSGVKGVYWYKPRQKWCAGIMVDGISIHLGYFTTLEEASLVRRTKANELFGLFANACESIS